MKYVFSFVTTEGAVRKVNQDSLFINTAEFDGEEIFFAAVCDGVGGLSGGEKASAYVCKRMSEWFANDFAEHMRSRSSILKIREAMDDHLHELNSRINDYAASRSSDMATTFTSLLIIPQLRHILIAHVGDSRLYRITDGSIDILTSDHSVVGQEVRNGIITEEMAEKDPRQNQLTNCIGAGLEDTSYDFSIADYSEGECYMLCSDGFRKKISVEEIGKALCPSANRDEKAMTANLEKLKNKVIERGEKDNITALMVKLC
ncbi:protein phosphatase 2C domain-containing protein [Ruminococcus sp.]|uniref:PP2C family protein-serine/threonine phosphatase n=1 Tax=Ruminococcus sp. TaxID=41978 RepID=UPI001B59EA7C|nr:protein phosphatase 2C domain-containing protein [Ruminococcus sp.]MBP5433459.1 serine/threonine-protein phosphatase [Ruminococcus sp.]